MKKYLFIAASALVLASCSSDAYLGDNIENTKPGESGQILFSMEGTKFQKDAHTDAAAKLNNRFIVWGEKKEADKSAASAENIVFKNYNVDYTASSANTTTSNTKDWEYVGVAPYAANVTPAAGVASQTIKYWDYSASNYIFTAISAKDADITAGNIVVTKTTAGTTDEYDKGYSIAVNASADLDNLFFADRVKIAQGTGTDRTAVNAYGGNVTFTFRNAATQVRVGMFETVSGYSVKIKQFKVVDSSTPSFSTMTTANTTNFAANFVNNAKGVAGTLTVKYYNAGTLLNQPTVSFNPTSAAANTLVLGTNLFGSAIGTTSSSPTYDKAARAWTSVFPKEDNTQSLKLKLDYTLTSPEGETIEVTDATAEIPAQYLKWKANYQYTYLFKISDNTNGSTGNLPTAPAGLYPITFDAVVENAGNGTSDVITTVSEPSISTFGVKANKYIVSSTDYVADADIYATFMEGSAVKTPELGANANVNVYKVTTADATNFPITEASVAESVANPTNNKITATLVNTDASTNFTAAPAAVTSVPAEDGTTVTIDALKLTGVKAGTYAIEYVATSAWTGSYKKVYKIIIVH